LQKPAKDDTIIANGWEENAVEGPGRKPSTKRWKPGPEVSGRVVDLREWKRKRRLRQAGNREPKARNLYVLTVALLVLTGAAAVGSCVPSSVQPQCVLFTWLLGLLGSGAALVLHVLRHRLALRLLSIYVSCLAVAFVAALVKVTTMAH
jgi:hypothetical protein